MQKHIILNRLNSKTVKKGDHWLYIGALKNGYGHTKHGPAHRLSAWIFLGLNLESTTDLALHKNECGYKNCWNPDHLYVGNYSNNHRDAQEVGFDINIVRRTSTHCKRGHEFTKENTYTYYNRRHCRQCQLDRGHK